MTTPTKACAKSAPAWLGVRLPDEGRHLLYLARRKNRACSNAESLHRFLRVPQTVQKLRRSYFLPLVYLLMDAGLIFLCVLRVEYPAASLLTMPKNDVIQGVSLLLGSIIGMFSGAQERKEMRTLKCAMEDCEYVEKMPRNRWAGVDRALSLIVVVLMVAVLFGKGGYSKYGDDYDERRCPIFAPKSSAAIRSIGAISEIFPPRSAVCVFCRRNAVCGND